MEFCETRRFLGGRWDGRWEWGVIFDGISWRFLREEWERRIGWGWGWWGGVLLEDGWDGWGWDDDGDEFFRFSFFLGWRWLVVTGCHQFYIFEFILGFIHHPLIDWILYFSGWGGRSNHQPDEDGWGWSHHQRWDGMGCWWGLLFEDHGNGDRDDGDDEFFFRFFFFNVWRWSWMRTVIYIYIHTSTHICI